MITPTTVFLFFFLATSFCNAKKEDIFEKASMQFISQLLIKLDQDCITRHNISYIKAYHLLVQTLTDFKYKVSNQTTPYPESFITMLCDHHGELVRGLEDVQSHFSPCLDEKHLDYIRSVRGSLHGGLVYICSTISRKTYIGTMEYLKEAHRCSNATFFAGLICIPVGYDPAKIFIEPTRICPKYIGYFTCLSTHITLKCDIPAMDMGFFERFADLAMEATPCNRPSVKITPETSLTTGTTTEASLKQNQQQEPKPDTNFQN